MASPWKYFARLVSSRREKKRDKGSIEEVKPELLAIFARTETLAEESLEAADLPADAEAPRHDAADTVPPKTAPLNDVEGKGAVGDTVDSQAASGIAVTDPTLSHDTESVVIEAKDNVALRPGPDGVTRKRTARNKPNEAILVASQPSSRVQRASEDPVSLNEEIIALRAELVRKLQLQNAQLKKMLARFER